MAVLSVMNFDDELLRLAKSAAALKGETLRDFTHRTFADALGFEVPKGIDTGTKNLNKRVTGPKKQSR